jgi:4a-hydroxytetrahydrobiopterin dehydratase
MDDGITVREFQAADGTRDWRVVGDGAQAFYRTRTLGEAARFVGAIGALPGIDEHRPDIDIRHDGVTVRIVTRSDDWYGMTTRDVESARGISRVARELGFDADPTRVKSFLVIPGAPKGVDVMPFWQALLDYERRPDSPEEDLVDPADRLPGFWFEAMNDPRGDDGGAIHVALWLPEELAEARVAAALAAGGHMVYDHSPSWWTLADAAGNEADVSTTANRE